MFRRLKGRWLTLYAENLAVLELGGGQSCQNMSNETLGRVFE